MAASIDIKKKRDELFERELLPLIDALYNFVFHLTHHEADANDLVQEAYLKAYRFPARNKCEGLAVHHS